MTSLTDHEQKQLCMIMHETLLGIIWNHQTSDYPNLCKLWHGDHYFMNALEPYANGGSYSFMNYCIHNQSALWQLWEDMPEQYREDCPDFWSGGFFEQVLPILEDFGFPNMNLNVIPDLKQKLLTD